MHSSCSIRLCDNRDLRDRDRSVIVPVSAPVMICGAGNTLRRAASAGSVPWRWVLWPPAARSLVAWLTARSSFRGPMPG